MAESGARQLLPQGVQDFVFAPLIADRREKQKNYVFVDEHNRHRRLKVMRACEGCRRRKTKCDAATTNTWPCAACVRLKMICIPPSSDTEQDHGLDSESASLRTNGNEDLFLKNEEDVDYNYALPQFSFHNSYVANKHTDETPGDAGREAQTSLYHATSQRPDSSHRSTIRGTQSGHTDLHQESRVLYQSPPLQRWHSVDNNGTYTAEVAREFELMNAMGTLKISNEAVAPYIANQRGLAEAPAIQEFEAALPQQGDLDTTVRIPPGMMPSEQQAMQYFQYFFDNIHPYVPVINRSYFYRQWHSDRVSISPLILEAIFACSSQMLNHTLEGKQWLALASRHEDSFKDVPRLSTIQGLLVLLKAREAVPKRGYYYRSWTTVINLVAMAKDLELDQHHELHQTGRACGSTNFECATKTRIWNTLFVVELMIGGPQGRYDYGVSPETVDFDAAQSLPGLDESELQISQQFAQFMRSIRNVRESTALMLTLRKNKSAWALDPTFTKHNKDFDQWLRALPGHLQVAYPPDGSAPWIPSHFVANLHSYHHLTVIMHHRPQLQFLSESLNGSWKREMLTCYSAATKLCRLQEAVLDNFGMAGLLCMQRGINFTIYTVLTCTMLHLVALTSPDPELSLDAPDYFTRHMRILEQCSRSWPMPEMQLQIDSLRLAFSADMNRPFELRANFPYGSPGRSSKTSSPGEAGYGPPGQDYMRPVEYSSQAVHGQGLMTPPRSSGNSVRLGNDIPATQSLLTMGMGPIQENSAPASMQMQDQPIQWNPSRIFDQWNTAFGAPVAAAATAQAPMPQPLPISNANCDTHEAQSANYATYNHTPTVLNYSTLLPQVPNEMPQQTNFMPPHQTYITPSMWQDAVASTYGDGLKRRWDSVPTEMMGRVTKRTR